MPQLSRPICLGEPSAPDFPQTSTFAAGLSSALLWLLSQFTHTHFGPGMWAQSLLESQVKSQVLVPLLQITPSYSAVWARSPSGPAHKSMKITPLCLTYTLITIKAYLPFKDHICPLHQHFQSSRQRNLMGNHALPPPQPYHVSSSGPCWNPSLWPGGPWVWRFALTSATIWWSCTTQVCSRISGQEKFKALKLYIRKTKNHILHP